MATLVPHLLLRTDDEGPSAAAIALREADYFVTKVFSDESAVHLAMSLDISGIVVELPALATIAFVRLMRERLSPMPPILAVTPSPVLVTHAAGVEALDPRDLGALVSATDLMLVAHDASLRVARMHEASKKVETPQA